MKWVRKDDCNLISENGYKGGSGDGGLTGSTRGNTGKYDTPRGRRSFDIV